MNEATIALTIMSLLILAIFLGFLVWGIRSGQFKNVEEAKFQVFRQERKSASNHEHSEAKRKKGDKA